MINDQIQSINNGYWYSQKQLLFFLALFFFTVSTISIWIPPLQSPDEPNHLKRAYLLTKGKIFLDAQNGITGGEIDRGLLNFMDSFSHLPGNVQAKVTSLQIDSAKKIAWQEIENFSELPNTAVYFPLSYLPHAIALSIGELLDLSVYQSYLLTRLVCLITALVIIYCASYLYPIPPLAIACLLIPMSIFQFGSASLDSINYALCFLIAATFSKMHIENIRPTKWQLTCLIVSLFAFITTRINFVALALIPISIFLYRDKKLGLYVSIILFILAIIWSFYGLFSVKGIKINRDLSTIEIIQYYLNDPSQFLKVLLNTFSKWGLMRQYWEQFIGKLGWLDTPIFEMGGIIYIIYFVIFIYIAYITKTKFEVLQKNHYRTFYIFIIFLCWLTLFIILLLAWTNHPAGFIDGIQGRYFTPFLILIAYSNFDQIKNLLDIKKIYFTLSALLLMSTLITFLTLQNRYWF